MEIQGGPLGDSFEDHVTIPYLTVPGFKWERVDTVHAAAATKDIAVFRDLQQERPSYFVLAVFLQVLDDEDASFVIELDFTVDKIRSHHLNRLASGFLGNHVDRFLRECVP